MSTQSSRESTRSEEQDEAVTPACDTSLTGGETRWKARPSAAYPPGYPRLCTACFAGYIPDEAWNEDSTAEFPHTEVCHTLVCSSQQGTSRRYHISSQEVEK